MVISGTLVFFTALRIVSAVSAVEISSVRPAERAFWLNEKNLLQLVIF